MSPEDIKNSINLLEPKALRAISVNEVSFGMLGYLDNTVNTVYKIDKYGFVHNLVNSLPFRNHVFPNN